MPRLTPQHLFCFCLTLILLLTAAMPAGAALPSQQALTQQLERLNPDDTSATTQALRETYQQIQTTLNTLAQLRERTDTLNQQIADQPQQLRELRTALDTARAAVVPDTEQLTLEQLEQRLTETRAELVQLEQRRDQLLEAISRTDERLISLRARLAKLKQEADQPAPALESGLSTQLRDARESLREALAEEQAARIQALELELLVLPGENELNQLRLTRVRRQLEQAQSRIETLQSRLLERRRSQLESAVEQLGPDPETLPPPLAEIAQQNQHTSEQLRALLRELDTSNQRQQRLGQQLEQISQRYRLIQQQLELDLPQLSAELRRFTRQLMRPLDTAATRAQINQLRLANLTSDRDLLVAEQLQAQPPEALAQLPDSARLRYLDLLDTRIGLLEQLRSTRQQLINARSQLLGTQQQINEQLQQARVLIGQHLLWLPSVPPLSLAWPEQFRAGLQHLSERWAQLEGVPLLQAEARYWLLIGVPLALALIAWGVRRYLRRHCARWHEQIGRVTQDRISRTLRLLLAGPLLAAPLPVFALLLEGQLNPNHPIHDSLVTLLQTSAATTFIYLLALTWLRVPHGLLAGHLDLSVRLCRVLRREVQILFWGVLPLLAGFIIADGLEESALLASAGRLLFLLLVALLLRFWWILWSFSDDLNRLASELRWWRDARVWIGALLVFNVAMLGLGIAGYLVSALFLMLVVAILVLEVVLIYVLYRLGLRWLLIEERRFAFRQALQRRDELRKARERERDGERDSGDEVPLEENYLDLNTISLQAQTLLQLLSLSLLVLLIWLTLGDLLPTLQVLERVQLWSTYQTTASGEALTAITLGDITTGFAILLLSLVAAYNLPGLLELLVLRHLRLTPGTGYAITTLLKYMLILVGVMAGTNQFGLEWSKLQWLVAALGVGLGFGLQEIVANFVSGLILLFEKPIRIGDTVTIGDVTGNVSRIQIRATTLVDWDRKEVVIPNKTFITERLINWSLTDSTTRIVLQVGVAYGSDTEKVKQLLIEAAREHPDVLDDPAPDAYFRAFGNSTLDFDLRVYVSRMEDRIPVTDGLNHCIDRRFREAGIEIAFPQLDVHLHRPARKPPPPQDS
jgi:potassium efflux system protein